MQILLKTSHGTLQSLSFDWIIGYGIHIPWATNMVGVLVSENSREAQISQFFGCL